MLSNQILGPLFQVLENRNIDEQDIGILIPISLGEEHGTCIAGAR
jgi:hypothetical protein